MTENCSIRKATQTSSMFARKPPDETQKAAVLFEPGSITRAHMKMMTMSGLTLRVDMGPGGPDAKGASRGGAGRLLGAARGVHATSAHLRQPPTSSPRLDAILLQDQLKREMRERQARYTGICPVRERIYAAVFDDLIAAVSRDASKRETPPAARSTPLPA